MRTSTTRFGNLRQGPPGTGHTSNAIWRSGRIGLTIQLRDHHHRRFLRRRKEIGALVSSVEDRGPAAQAGIRPGDIILELDSKRFASLDQLNRLLAESDDNIVLLVQRDDEKLSISIKLA